MVRVATINKNTVGFLEGGEGVQPVFVAGSCGCPKPRLRSTALVVIWCWPREKVAQCAAQQPNGPCMAAASTSYEIPGCPWPLAHHAPRT